MAKKKAAATATKRKSRAKPPREASSAGERSGSVSEIGKKMIGLIGAASLKSLIKSIFVLGNQVSTISGDMGKLVADAAAQKSLHRGAFSDIKKLYRMGRKDPAKLWLHLAHFDHMRKTLELDAMAKEQGEMLPPGVEEEETGETETGTDAAPEREARTGDRVREVAETAGAKLN